MPKVLNYKVIVEQDEDGVFVASAPDIPGCHAQGKTYEEALKNIKQVIDLCLQVAEDIPNYKDRINYDYDENQSRFIGITNIAIQI
ncbi:MAG TPA: type II toxin-antitoxin system HicB family antitoxin [Alphaproteobacteria bacterium]|jgi:predicted RNase H-like HicB family nuclease|nr:type II toxin-antitoxin system HicB family antitoxin [Alphaproteobacteria bacterium]